MICKKCNKQHPKFKSSGKIRKTCCTNKPKRKKKGKRQIVKRQRQKGKGQLTDAIKTAMIKYAKDFFLGGNSRKNTRQPRQPRQPQDYYYAPKKERNHQWTEW